MQVQKLAGLKKGSRFEIPYDDKYQDNEYVIIGFSTGKVHTRDIDDKLCTLPEELDVLQIA